MLRAVVVFENSHDLANYAQWRRAENFEAMLGDPRAAEHIKPIREIATSDAHLSEVVESFTAMEREGERT
jgi:hypothetical protein